MAWGLQPSSINLIAPNYTNQMRQSIVYFWFQAHMGQMHFSAAGFLVSFTRTSTILFL